MPFPYKRILCPVDFDEYSADVLKEAAALASSSGATLHILHVVPIKPPLDEAATGGLAVGEIYEPQLQLARRQIDQMLAAVPSEVKREVAIDIGRPGDTILDAETKFGVDLVVMATHGRKGLKHLVLGSVAERIVRESRVPVLTIRPVSSQPSG
jgi:universal stress protein A